jgi:predicted acyl esterase
VNIAFSYVEISIPTRLSGTMKFLKADLYASDSITAKPVILIQTPYNKALYRLTGQINKSLSSIYDTANYNYVILDWRGFYANKFQDTSGYNRGLDGYDVVEWISNQKWCNGKIGTWGGSALGQIQFLTAQENPPHLICAAPFIKDFKTKYEDYYYGGDFRKEHCESLEKLGLGNTPLILANPIKNNVWKFVENQNKSAEKINIPMFLCTGWFDHFPSDVIRAFEDLQTKSAPSVKGKHKMIIGPWLHSGIDNLQQGEMEYPEAVGEAARFGKYFLDFYLLNRPNNWENYPVLSYYEINGNWKFASNWSDIKREKDTLYLNEQYRLTEYPPFPKMSPIEQFPDTINYNPLNPSPTMGGSRFNPTNKDLPVGPIDISKTVENRNDILVYTSDTLNSDYIINGKTNIELFFKSNREDSDFSVRLCDVFPDGKSYILTQGIKRARFRETTTIEKLLVPNELSSITVELSDLSYKFQKDHRIRIDISSSNYPMFDLNLNNGKEMYKAGDTLSATNLIYRTNSNASKVIFSIPINISSVINTEVNDDILIFPNPASNELNISNLIPISKIQIFDIEGNEIKNEFKVNANFINVNLQNYVNGIYYIKYSNPKGTFIKKFVISK